MSRAEGYYWVTDHGAEPEVAAWHGHAWWLTGQEESVRERAITVLSERLAAPDWPAWSGVHGHTDRR